MGSEPPHGGSVLASSIQWSKAWEKATLCEELGEVSTSTLKEGEERRGDSLVREVAELHRLRVG